MRRWLGGLWLAFLVVVAVFPTVLTTQDPLRQNLRDSLQGPSAHHFLGTDRLGRDLLSRVVHGTGYTLVAVAIAVAVSVVVGVGLGLLAGYAGGVTDALVMRLSDALFAVPGMIVLLVVMAVFRNNLSAAMLTFGVLMASGLIRVVRSATRSTREELFVAAAKVSGLSAPQIMWRHLLPRLTSLVVVQASLIACIALVTQAGLAFLGFGPPPPAPSWGAMIDEARSVLTQAPWTLAPPGLAVVATVLAISVLGDALRDSGTRRWSSSKLVWRSPAAPDRHVPVTPPDPAQLLSVRDLTVLMDTPVVTGVSFDIGAGEVLGLIGESGCGKTVTALSILGLTPGGGRITRGACVFAGLDLTRATPQQWRQVRGRGIGYVAQDPMVSLDPAMRVGALLGRQAPALLRDVGLDPATARLYPHELSGGMAQRVAIAFALAANPRLLIADEPTTALDVPLQAEVLALLRRLVRERGMAALVVSHDLGVIAELCDRAVVLYAGEVVEQCTVADLFAAPRHPYTAALLAADPHRTVAGGRLPAIPGTVPTPADWPSGCRFAPRCAHAVSLCHAGPVPLSIAPDGRVARCVRADDLTALAVAS